MSVISADFWDDDVDLHSQIWQTDTVPCTVMYGNVYYITDTLLWGDARVSAISYITVSTCYIITQ